MKRLQIKVNHNKSNETLVFGERGKPEYLGKYFSEQRVREPTNSSYSTRRARIKLNIPTITSSNARRSGMLCRDISFGLTGALQDPLKY